jgi:hypothetical protein
MTIQISERIIYHECEFPLIDFPDIPDNHPFIEEDKNCQLSGSFCWRMYVGIWEIRIGKLFLINISGKYKLKCDEPLFADWYNGQIRIAKGILIKYLSNSVVYEAELRLSIEKGYVVNSENVDNRIRYGIPNKFS